MGLLNSTIVNLKDVSGAGSVRMIQHKKLWLIVTMYHDALSVFQRREDKSLSKPVWLGCQDIITFLFPSISLAETNNE